MCGGQRVPHEFQNGICGAKVVEERKNRVPYLSQEKKNLDFCDTSILIFTEPFLKFL